MFIENFINYSLFYFNFINEFKRNIAFINSLKIRKYRRAKHINLLILTK